MSVSNTLSQNFSVCFHCFRRKCTGINIGPLLSLYSYCLCIDVEGKLFICSHKHKMWFWAIKTSPHICAAVSFISYCLIELHVIYLVFLQKLCPCSDQYTVQSRTTRQLLLIVLDMLHCMQPDQKSIDSINKPITNSVSIPYMDSSYYPIKLSVSKILF